MKQKFIMQGRFLKIVALAAILILSACNRDNNSPGWDYFPDMAYSYAYESFSPNPNFADGKTEREPVKGTMSRELIPFPYEKTDEDRIRAGKELFNPIPLNDTTLARGKDEYTAYCMMCHGEKGDGMGYLYTSKKYIYPPANLLADKVKILPDGQIYHTITLGIRIMGAHGSLLRPEDRWKIIHYVKNVLQK
jgi:mono/diheme cytochrome c family protein